MTDLIGHKVESRSREKTIREHLVRAFDGPSREAARKPAA